MEKSQYLETLGKLQNALTKFDMSFDVSSRIMRIALVSEILDTAFLFEQLYQSWCEHLPYGEGPDADIDFAYWKELSNWESLLSGAKQNACIDDYPFDMGNGMTSDKIHVNRRKNYLRSVYSVFRRSGYSGNEAASFFVKTVNGDQKHMMTFGNMVYEALTPLLLTLEKIDMHLSNPDKSLYTDYFERQRSRFESIFDGYGERIQNIMNEDLPERRKCNKLNALKDEIWQKLYESNFLDVLKDGINTYDINDYRNDHPDTKKTEDEIREVLALEELVDNNIKPNKEKAGQYIFKHRKSLSSNDIAAFYVYLYTLPIILKGIDTLRRETTEESTDDGSIIVGFSSAVIVLSKSKNIIEKIHQLMENKTKPKDIMMPIRAAMDAGVIRRPTWEEFCCEFGNNRVKSKSSLSDYTNPKNKPYDGADFEAMREAFKVL